MCQVGYHLGGDTLQLGITILYMCIYTLLISLHPLFFSPQFDTGQLRMPLWNCLSFCFL